MNNSSISQGEIVIYQPADEKKIQLEVKVDGESVWLNRQQLAMLFDWDVKTIGKNIKLSIIIWT